MQDYWTSPKASAAGWQAQLALRRARSGAPWERLCGMPDVGDGPPAACQTEAEIELKPGKRKLVLQFADGAHVSFGADLAAVVDVVVK